MKRRRLWLIWSNERQEFRKAESSECPACAADTLHSRLDCPREPFTPLIHKATRYPLGTALSSMDHSMMRSAQGYAIPKDLLIPAPESIP